MRPQRSPLRLAVRAVLSARALRAAIALAGSFLVITCADNTGPGTPVPGYLSLAPQYVSEAAGIVPVAAGRFVLTRGPGGEIVQDTLVSIALGADSVDLSFRVPMQTPSELFLLYIRLMNAAGDTVFRAGPLEVAPSTSTSTPTPVEVQLAYSGVGHNAGAVVITPLTGAVVAGTATPIVAQALDSAGTPIAGTPVGWRSLDTAVVRVPDRAVGSLVGIARGQGRIVAALLTGPADTATVNVVLPPANLLPDSGSGQTGPAAGLLPQQLVARVTASDGVGVPNVWVRFAVTLGGGSVSGDSVLSDSTGRARVAWTLGNVVGTQTVTATTAALPSASATFTATSQATGPGSVTIAQGDGQSALIGAAVAVAPAVLVRDQQNNPVPNIQVVFAVTQGGGTLTGATTTTNASGVATLGSWTLGTAVGLNALTATVSGLTPVQFVALATSTGGVTSMTLNGGDGQSALATTAVAIAPSVLLTDTAGTPIPGVAVTFAVTNGAGTLADTTPVSDANGVASVGTWTLGAPGLNSIVASLPGLASITFQATGTVGAPAQVVIVSGDAQSETAGTTLPLPLVVEVRDSVGNPVSNVSVSWNTFDGSITPPTGATGGGGQAQASWTLGTNKIVQTATATVAGLTPVVFTATAVYPNPSILLAIQGADRIRLSDSVLLDVTLTAPAGIDGVVLNFSVDNPAIVGLDTTDLSIAQDGTSTQLRLYGLSQGTTTVRATASGYVAGAVAVLVTQQVLSMPTTLNVPFGSTASVPLQISAPAPAGGVTVTLVSSNPTAVGVVTPTVTIPEGQQAANATLAGVAPGTATVTGSTTDFGIAQTAAVTRANLNIVEGSSTFAQSFTDTLTVRLESSGSQIAAPAPGIEVTLTARNPDCVAATSPVTIPTGLVNTTMVASYGGVATTPCATYLVAEAPAIEPDSIYVTVNPPPTITAPAYSLGSGLQFGSNGYGDLQVSNHGGVDVTITSADPGTVLVAPNQSTVGGASLTLSVANGQRYFYYNLQALEGVTDSAKIQLTFSAPGFTTGTQIVTVRPIFFEAVNIPTTTTTFSPDVAFYVYIGYSLPNYTYIVEQQPIRAGGQPITITFANDSAGVGNLVTTAGAGDTASVVVAVGSSTSPTSVVQGGVAYNPDNAGVTTISASATPAIGQKTYYNRTITVTAPTITASALTLGSGLQLGSNTYGDLGASNHGGVNVTITSADPARLLVSPDGSTVGSDTLVLSVADGQRYFYYMLQALEGVVDSAKVDVTYSAPGFTSAVRTMTVRPMVFDVLNVPQSLTTFSTDVPFYAYIGYTLPGYPYVVEQQPIRAGGQPVSIFFVNDSVGVGDLTRTAGAGDTATVTIAVGSSYSPTSVAQGGVAYNPDNPGVTRITATATPAIGQLTYYNRQITVTAPTITAVAHTLGSGLQLGSNTYGDLGASNHGGVNVTIASADPSRVVVSADAATVGSDTLVLSVADGQRYFYYMIQAIEGVVDSAKVSLTYTAPGFVSGSQTITVRPPAFDVYGIPSTTTTFSPNSVMYAYLGYSLPGYTYLVEQQPIRTGGQPVTVTFVNDTLAIGNLVTSTTIGDTASATIAVGSSYSPTSVAQGGVAYDPDIAGVTTISVSIPGFEQRTYYGRTITVSSPAITLYETSVGAGLQKQWNGYLSAANHGGVAVTIESSAPGVAVLSDNSATAGAGSTTINVPDGSQYFYFYVQGVENQVGTVSLTARAAGFTDGTAPLNVVQPVVGVYGLPTSLQAGADSVAFYAQIGISSGQNQYLSEAQTVRAGASAVSVTLSSGTPSVGQLVTASQPGGSASVTVQIQPGAYYSPLTVATGGAAFKPLASGTTIVSSAASGFVTLSIDGNRTVSVNP